MNCKTVRGLFSLCLDEGMCYEEQRAFVQHLNSCAACAGEYRKFERAIGLVRDLPQIPPPDMFLQNVVHAARETQRERQRPPVRSLGERIREFFGGLEWLGSPRVAPAALALGLVVGVAASVYVLRPDTPVEVARVQTPAAVEGSTPTRPAPSTGDPIVGPASVPVVSGPFEDLVDQMMVRLGTDSPGVTDTTDALNGQWGPTRDAAGVGQQVGAGPVTSRAGNRGGRVYVVF